MIMERMQRRSRWRGNPGGRRPRLGMSDLLLHHARHKIGHRPHALADLGMALKAAGKDDIDVPVLIGLDPYSRLDRILADDGASIPRGLDIEIGSAPFRERGCQ